MVEDVLEIAPGAATLEQDTRSRISRLMRIRQMLPPALIMQDTILICASLVGAYWARFVLQLGPPTHGVGFPGYQLVAVLLLGVMVPTLVAKGAYRTRLSTDMVSEIVIIASAATMTVGSVVVLTFLLHQSDYSRGVIVYAWGFLIILLVFGRAVYRGIQRLYHRRGLGVRRLLVVGASDVAKMVMQGVQSRPDLGYEVVGFVHHAEFPSAPDFGRFRALGSVADIPDLLETRCIDEVVVALPASAHEDVRSVVSLCERGSVGLKLVPDLFHLNLNRVQVDDILGIPLLDVREQPLRSLSRAVKRSIDIVAGSIVLFLSLPLMAILAVLIRLDSGGPIFIRQVRMGQDGRLFSCYKLRTMRPDAEFLLPALQSRNEATGPLFKIRNDPRCTQIGRYLRRWSLDEIPQIWNVVRGEMSLVGPRPPLPSEVKKYESWQLRRIETKPGITGIWQVSGRSNLSFEEMVMMDIYYVDNWSLLLDVKILFRTFVAVFTGHGAY